MSICISSLITEHRKKLVHLHITIDIIKKYRFLTLTGYGDAGSLRSCQRGTSLQLKGLNSTLCMACYPSIPRTHEQARLCAGCSSCSLGWNTSLCDSGHCGARTGTQRIGRAGRLQRTCDDPPRAVICSASLAVLLVLVLVLNMLPLQLPPQLPRVAPLTSVHACLGACGHQVPCPPV